jgi:hypothetical protein
MKDGGRCELQRQPAPMAQSLRRAKHRGVRLIRQKLRWPRRIKPGHEQRAIRGNMRPPRRRPRNTLLGRRNRRTLGRQNRRALRQNQTQRRMFRHTDLVAHQPVGMGRQRNRPTPRQPQAAQQQHRPRIAKTRHRPINKPLRQRPTHRPHRRAGRRKAEIGRSPGITRIMPIGMPTRGGRNLQSYAQGLVRRIGVGIGHQPRDCPWRCDRR